MQCKQIWLTCLQKSLRKFNVIANLLPLHFLGMASVYTQIALPTLVVNAVCNICSICKRFKHRLFIVLIVLVVSSTRQGSIN